MRTAKSAVTIVAVLVCVVAFIAGLHLRKPHRISPSNPALTYRVVHDENFYDVAVAISERVPRQHWCGLLSKAATDFDNSARDYMMKDSIHIDAYLETTSGVSTTPVARFRRYVPIKNPQTPWWVRWLEFPKDDRCTVLAR